MTSYFGDSKIPIILEINQTKYNISFLPRLYISNEAYYDNDCLDVCHFGFLDSKTLAKFRQRLPFKNLRPSLRIFASDLLSKFWKLIAGKNSPTIGFQKIWKLAGEFLPATLLSNFCKFIAGEILKARKSLTKIRFDSSKPSKLRKLRAFKIMLSIEFSKFWKQSLAKFWTISFQKSFQLINE